MREDLLLSKVHVMSPQLGLWFAGQQQNWDINTLIRIPRGKQVQFCDIACNVPHYRTHAKLLLEIDTGVRFIKGHVVESKS